MGKPTVRLTGEDGNAFSVMAKCKRSAQRAGWSKDQIDNVVNEMMSGDYDHLLQTAMKYFEVE